MRNNVVVMVLATALVSWGCATAPPLAPEQPLQVSPVGMSGGEQRVTDNVFIVTDGSGTTYADKTFPRAKALSQSFAGAMPDATAPAKSRRYNAGAIGFGGNDRSGMALSAFDRSALRSAVDQAHVMGKIDGKGGETPINHVLTEIGGQLAGQQGPAAVVLFTDGDVSCPGPALQAAQALAAGHKDGVCIHAVQVGARPGAEAFLRDLTSAGSKCGSYRPASDVASAGAFTSFVRGVMMEQAPSAPPKAKAVAPAFDACKGMVLTGVRFETNSHVLVPESVSILDHAAAQLRTCQEVKITVEGHTDSRGSDAYNQQLSERRAGSVLDYLVRAGVNSERLNSVGVGEARPIDSNDTKDGRANNRRVELMAR